MNDTHTPPLDLLFFAPDQIPDTAFGDEDAFTDAFLISDEAGPAFVTMRVSGHGELVMLLEFLFGKNITPEIIFSKAQEEIMDLTACREQCLTASETEKRYEAWLALSGRKNTQDEFADLAGIAGFVSNNQHKKHLLLRVAPTPEIVKPLAPVYPQLQVTITRFISKDNPYFIECRFMDVLGKEHIIHEKVPVITHEDLDENSTYPRPGSIACEIMEQYPVSGGSEILIIDTSKPWGIETTTGETIFEVDAAQVLLP